MSTKTGRTRREAIRGSVLHFLDDPVAGDTSYEFHADGLLIVEDG